MMATKRSRLRATRRVAKTWILRRLPKRRSRSTRGDGHKEESPKGHKEEEPKDKDDSDKEEDHKPEKALLWLETGKDPQRKSASNWLFEGEKQKQKSNNMK